MTDYFLAINNVPCTSLDVYAPARGVWFLDAMLDDQNLPSGAVVVTIGSLKLNGTIMPAYSGQFVLQRSCRVVAGNGGWATYLKQKSYHSDSGVSPRQVVEDAARESGETIGSFPDLPIYGTDYMRSAGMAETVLDVLLGNDAVWWVDQKGITQVAATRPTITPPAGSYNLLMYSPLHRRATIGLDDPGVFWVNSVLTDRLTEPQTIREFELHATKTELRVVAYTGGDDSTDSRLGRAFDALCEQRERRHIWGKYRYRVITRSGERINLQAVRRVTGLPDALPATIIPGAPGIWAKLTLGTEVLVEFIEGDPRCPIVTGFAPRDATGHVTDGIEIAGGEGTTVAPVVRLGDTGVAFFPPVVPMTGLVNGVTPFTGTIQITTPIPVSLNSGSGKVSCG
jgi:hypothetical protein